MAVLVQKTINLVILKIAENGCIGTRISRRRNSDASILCLCLAYSLTPNEAFLYFSSIPLKWWNHLASIDIIFSRSFTDLQPVIWRTKSSYIPFEIYSLSLASWHSRLCRALSYPLTLPLFQAEEFQATAGFLKPLFLMRNLCHVFDHTCCFPWFFSISIYLLNQENRNCTLHLNFGLTTNAPKEYSRCYHGPIHSIRAIEFCINIFNFTNCSLMWKFWFSDESFPIDFNVFFFVRCPQCICFEKAICMYIKRREGKCWLMRKRWRVCDLSITQMVWSKRWKLYCFLLG